MLVYVKSPFGKHRLILGRITEIKYTFNTAYPWQITVLCLEADGIEINVGSVITCVALSALSFIRIRKGG